MPRNYQQEYANYDGTEAVKKKRAQRNKARRMLEREGVVKKGDGKDVHHVTPLSKGGTSARKNLKAQPATTNRSFPRKANGGMK